MVKRTAVDTFYETMGETILIFISFFVAFAAALGFGVTYNSARIALSERGRDLATLRVLGFTRGEIAYILLGEVGLLVFVGLPLGCLTGWGLAFVMAQAFDTELFRIPLVVEPSTYGYGVLGALASGLASAVLLRRQLDGLDLVAALKTRE
jgi:putative ABC transport system permease protein